MTVGYSKLPIEQRLGYAQEITDEVLQERSRLYSLAFAIHQTIDRESNPIGADLVDLLEELLGDVSQLSRLKSCFSEAA
jgi:hypothetical protein